MPPAMPIQNPMPRTRSAIAAIPLAALLALIPLALPAEAAKLRPPTALHASKAATRAVALRWRDRSKGGSGFQVQLRRSEGKGKWRSKRVRGTSARFAKLRRGTVYDARARVCKRKRCSRWSRSTRAATLLAPYNGPHPDPRCTAFPAADEFNRDISAAPLHPRSQQIVDQINADGGDALHPDFGSNPGYGIPYVVVPRGQPLVPLRFTAYGDESDPGPYPIPPGAPVEGGPGADGDRHVLVVRRPASPGGSCDLFELYRAFERGRGWSADAAALFDLGSPLAGQRPDGWTSADAAGLPIYPGLVTYEEVRSGVIDHAIRVTFEETRRAYVSPATHYASDSCDPDRPAMGMRLRLRPGYDLSGIGGDARVIATALKRYGMMVADNGSNWFFTGSTDRRWDDEDLGRLKEIPGSAFQVVRSGAETSPC